MQRKGAGAGGLLKSKQQSPAELVEPLDSDEQEQVVKDLKVQIVKQSKRWRIAFCIGYSLIAVIFLFCAAYGSFFPWRFHHQYIFANHLHFAIFQCYYFLSFIVFGFSAKFILHSIKASSSLELYSIIIIAIGVAIGWCTLFYRYSVHTPSVFWLPIADLAGVGFALYLDSDLSGSLNDVEQLEGLKYEFKRI